MIDSRDVTVLVCGPVPAPAKFSKTLKSITQFFPKSPKIMSTWFGEIIPTSGFFDECVYSADPGGEPLSKKRSNKLSTHRIILSAQAGLARVKTRYTLRVRSDLIFTSSNLLLDWAQIFPGNYEDKRVFREKVIVPSLYSRTRFPRPGGFFPAFLHLSDWAVFGKTESLRSLFAIPLPEDGSATFFSELNPPEVKSPPYAAHVSFRFPPEMWIWNQALGSKKQIAPAHWLDEIHIEKHLEASKKLLLSNVVVLSMSDYGVVSHKYQMKSRWGWAIPDVCLSTMTTLEYETLHAQHFGCAGSFSPSVGDQLSRIMKIVWLPWLWWLGFKTLWKTPAYRTSLYW